MTITYHEHYKPVNKNNHKIQFSNSIHLARFLSEIIKLGLTYTIHNGIDCWIVELTGGF